MAEKTEAERIMHGAIDRALPVLEKLERELSKDGYAIRSLALNEVRNDLRRSRPRVAPHDGGR